MKELLQTLEKAYDYPVDTEFTINFMPDSSVRINLLQCRPLQTWKRSGHRVKGERRTDNSPLLKSRARFMGGDDVPIVDRIIYIEPEAYIALPVKDKYQVARLVGRINRAYSAQPRSLAFIGPGRWGTTTPSLGVPVNFAEICQAGLLVEVAYRQQGYVPELSYGTHFFQDLVETRIYYVALFPEEENSIFNPEQLASFQNSFPAMWPEYARWQDVIKLIDLQAQNQALYIDLDWRNQDFSAYIDKMTH